MTEREILRLCRDAGFAVAGIAPAGPPPRPETLRRWLGEGRHGEMHWLADRVDRLLDPGEVLPGARSILCVADRYHDGSADPPRPRWGRIARYARGRDYHHVMKRRLHTLCDQLAEHLPGERFKACVDTAPVLERDHAVAAGLGAIGKHTLLIEPGLGSWVLLGVILTTASLEPTGLPGDSEIDPCGLCTRCIDACPTDAITPWSVDARRCISYLTIEHRTVIDADLHAAMGDWVFGCDICQEVCPHGRSTVRSEAAPRHEAYASDRDGFDLLALLQWSETDRREAFTGSAMKRARHDMMRRNALIAAGNQLARGPDRALQRRVEAIAGDPDEPTMVQETARQVLDGSCRV